MFPLSVSLAYTPCAMRFNSLFNSYLKLQLTLSQTMTVISKYDFIKYLCLMTSGGVDNGVIAFTFESVKHILGTGDMETVMGMTF